MTQKGYSPEMLAVMAEQEARRKSSPILCKLEDERIFSVRRDGDRVLFTESCDDYYEMRLSVAEVRQLISELTSMVEGKSP
jgi:hypothetical protein